jgi:hypothetical protein
MIVKRCELQLTASTKENVISNIELKQEIDNDIDIKLINRLTCPIINNDDLTENEVLLTVINYVVNKSSTVERMLKSDAIHVRTIRPYISVHFKIVDPCDNIILEKTHYKATYTNESKVQNDIECDVITEINTKTFKNTLKEVLNKLSI